MRTKLAFTQSLLIQAVFTSSFIEENYHTVKVGRQLMCNPDKFIEWLTSKASLMKPREHK